MQTTVKSQPKRGAKNQSSKLLIYKDERIVKLRYFLIDKHPWFVAKDVCSLLSISDSTRALERLDSDEKQTRLIYSSGQNRTTSIIDESGFNALIVRSTKPAARMLRKWITRQVLPTIRQTAYIAPVPTVAPKLWERVEKQAVRLPLPSPNIFEEAAKVAALDDNIAELHDDLKAINRLHHISALRIAKGEQEEDSYDEIITLNKVQLYLSTLIDFKRV